mgnify:FL=1
MCLYKCVHCQGWEYVPILVDCLTCPYFHPECEKNVKRDYISYCCEDCWKRMSEITEVIDPLETDEELSPSDEDLPPTVPNSPYVSPPSSPKPRSHGYRTRLSTNSIPEQIWIKGHIVGYHHK